MALTTTLRMACFIRSLSTRILAASVSALTQTRMPAASAWGAAKSTISRTKESSGTSAGCSSTGRVKSRKVFTTRSSRRISREILRLDRVVKTFLDFTRPVELHPAEVPLDSFVREIVDLAAPQAEAAGIRVWVNADAEIGRAAG